MIALLALIACVDTTGGERISFEGRAVGLAPITQTADGPVIELESDDGFTVRLTEARLLVGPVYLWSDEPQLDAGDQASLWDWVMPVAHAAVDQFQAGFLVGEVPHQVELDLLSEQSVAIGPGSGLAGPSRSAEVWLEPGDGVDTLVVAGIAERGEERLEFEGAITFTAPWVPEDELADPRVLRRVRGLLWDVELRDGGVLEVGVDARSWLRGVELAPLLSDDPLLLSRGDALGNTIYFRAREVGSRGPWSLKWQD